MVSLTRVAEVISHLAALHPNLGRDKTAWSVLNVILQVILGLVLSWLSHVRA